MMLSKCQPLEASVSVLPLLKCFSVNIHPCPPSSFRDLKRKVKKLDTVSYLKILLHHFDTTKANP